MPRGPGGMQNIRPPKAVYVKLCEYMTRQDIAEQYDVTLAAVDKWSQTYGVKPFSQKYRGTPKHKSCFGESMLIEMPDAAEWRATPGPLPCYYAQAGA